MGLNPRALCLQTSTVTTRSRPTPSATRLAAPHQRPSGVLRLRALHDHYPHGPLPRSPPSPQAPAGPVVAPAAHHATPRHAATGAPIAATTRPYVRRDPGDHMGTTVRIQYSEWPCAPALRAPAPVPSPPHGSARPIPHHRARGGHTPHHSAVTSKEQTTGTTPPRPRPMMARRTG